MLILLFTPLLRNTISKLHFPFTPYGSIFILCKLLPNLGIQTSSSIAQLIMLPIIYNFKIDKPNNQNHSNQVTIPVPPYGGIRRIRPKPLQTMTSYANSPWAHLTQDTAGMANLTLPTPFPSGIQVKLPNSRFFAHKIIAK